jgi:formimidoylglutamate deiminase
VPLLKPELLYAEGAFLPGAALEFSAESGRIVRIMRPEDARDEPALELPGRALLPGFINAHSHAFQRLIRGRTQWRRERDPADFWTWRAAMYEAALGLEPDEVYAVSRQCFIEMLRAGFTAVGEFHYLHNDRSGRAYQDRLELANRVIAAAEDAGIRIRLLHVAYATGGIGEALRDEQRRFATPDLDRYLTDVAALASRVAGRDDVMVGVAPHSVRAVPADWLGAIHAFACERDMPFHMHASEQPAEVDACRAAHGITPIELIAGRGALDERTTIVHATHATAREIGLLGGATVCVCPTTERDLGDGFLPASALLEAGARLALGTDSQTVIAPFEEMRLIEYHERLRTLRRVVLARAESGGGPGRSAGHGYAVGSPVGRAASGRSTRLEVAPTLLRMGAEHGARSLRLDAGALEPGRLADFVTIDLRHPALEGWTPGTLAPLLALCAPPDVIVDVWVGGVQRIARGRHAAQDEAVAAYRAVAARFAAA